MHTEIVSKAFVELVKGILKNMYAEIYTEELKNTVANVSAFLSTKPSAFASSEGDFIEAAWQIESSILPFNRIELQMYGNTKSIEDTENKLALTCGYQATSLRDVDLAMVKTIANLVLPAREEEVKVTAYNDSRCYLALQATRGNCTLTFRTV